MRKIGGVTLLVALALTGSSVASAAPNEPRWITKSGEAFDINTVRFDASAVPAFKASTATIPGYGNATADSMAVIGRDLCEHYAGGFTTEDLLSAGGSSLAAVGEAAKVTVCA